MARLSPGAGWREALRNATDRPPRRPRLPLWWGEERIGSVEPDLFERAGLAGSPLLAPAADGAGWRIESDLTPALAQMAHVLHERRLGHVWRDELLAVRADSGAVLGAVERAAVRPLGIATHAVHLAAIDEQGRHCVQQRAFDKATDPGLWDTLVGGLVAASDSLQQALERESWEEAGLRLAQVRDLRHGGRLVTRRPSKEVPHGYVVETLDWFTCVLPAGVQPCNQDGEVAAFAALEAGEATRRLEQGGFTLDAGLVLLAAFDKYA